MKRAEQHPRRYAISYRAAMYDLKRSQQQSRPGQYARRIFEQRVTALLRASIDSGGARRSAGGAVANKDTIEVLFIVTCYDKDHNHAEGEATWSCQMCNAENDYDAEFCEGEFGGQPCQRKRPNGDGQ